MKFNVTVRVMREYKITEMEAVNEDDVREQLSALDSNNEINENMDVSCEDIEESEADFEIVKVKLHVEEEETE